MLKTLCVLMCGACCFSAYSAAPPTDESPFSIQRTPFGSGTPDLSGYENAKPVNGLGVWHVPQYLPGFPTAATVWPRVVSVRCKGGLCEGYVITPELGRGEYLFVVPRNE